MFNQRHPENASQIINDLSVRHDVECISSSTLPTNKMQRFDMMNTAFQTGVIRDNTAVIQYMDVPDVESLIEREDKIRQFEQALQQAQEQIKKLEGDLQTANRAEVQSRKRTEVEKFKSGLDQQKNRVERDVQVTSMRLKDEEKKVKEDNKPKDKK